MPRFKEGRNAEEIAPIKRGRASRRSQQEMLCYKAHWFKNEPFQSESSKHIAHKVLEMLTILFLLLQN